MPSCEVTPYSGDWNEQVAFARKAASDPATGRFAIELNALSYEQAARSYRADAERMRAAGNDPMVAFCIEQAEGAEADAAACRAALAPHAMAGE